MAKKKDANIVNLDEVNELWRAVFSDSLSHENVYILADGPKMALEKALDHQKNYTVICNWPMTSLDRISAAVI